MKNYLKLSLIVASSLLLSACGVIKNSVSDQPTSESKENSTVSNFSLRQLITQNIPQKCTYSGQNEEGSFTSEIVVSGKKFNQVLTYKSAEGEEKINSISDGEYVYTWGTHSAGGSFATKLKADFDTTTTPDESANTGETETQTETDLDTNYQGSCSATVVTDANFQPPKDIKFEDYSQFLDNLKSSMPSVNSKDSE